MYNKPNQYPNSCGQGRPSYNPYSLYDYYVKYLYQPYQYSTMHTSVNQNIQLRDYGKEPLVFNIERAAEQNNNFRTALWTGDNLQLTLMSINEGEDIGTEMHPDVDQFIRIEEGQGLVKIGDEEDKLDFQTTVGDDYAIIIPAGKWHNILNTGNKPLKLYSIYGPPDHPHGTVHKTKKEAEEAEMSNG